MAGIIGMRWNWHCKNLEAKAHQKEWRKIDAERSHIAHEKYLENERIKEEQKETKELLALCLLLGSNGNEETMNNACDIIKDLGLVEGYE